VKRSVLSTRAGFSLIEIILALGIISFTLVGILGLFPVAVNAAADSQHETQAALIARSMFHELESHPGTPNRTITVGGDLIDGRPVKVDLSKAVTLTDMAGFDSGGTSLSDASDTMAVYTVDLKTEPVTPANGLTRVDVTVKTKRTSFPFSTLLRQD